MAGVNTLFKGNIIYFPIDGDVKSVYGRCKGRYAEMLRKNFMVTPTHAKQIKKEATVKGVSMSEILRKALDLYFKTP